MESWVRTVMRMRRSSWVMVSSSSHLTTLSIGDVGISECRKLKSMNLEWCPMAQHPYQISWKSIQPFSGYWMRAYGYHWWRLWPGWTGLGQVRLGLVRLGYACDAHTQRIACNGIRIVPPHDFEQPLLRFFPIFGN
jgi:hypothetical protein